MTISLSMTPSVSDHLRLFVSKQAIEMYLNTDGRMELTRNGSKMALINIAAVTGKTYKRSMKGKREALADCIELLDKGA
jgi:biotin synthase-related radical SAM superfamily protein